MLKEVPPELEQTFPFLFDEPSSNENELEIQDFLEGGDYDEEYTQKVITHVRQHYASGVSALEKAFEDAGQPLLSLDTGGGDTLIFINVTPAIANRWRDVLFGYTHDNTELAVRSPMWDALWYHLEYALDLEMGDPPPSLNIQEVLRTSPNEL